MSATIRDGLRVQLVGASALAWVMLVSPGFAQTAAWKPEKTVEIVVGASPGGGTDITARVLQKLFTDKRLVDSSVVVNRPGGGQTVAWAYLHQRQGDGHYVQIINEPFVTNRIMGVSPLNYTDFTPLTLLFDEYVIFLVKPDSPIASGKDLVERLRKDPESVAFGFGSSRGNNTHMAIGMVAKAAGLNMGKLKIVVFQSGGEATTALLGGHVDVTATTPAAIENHFRAGRVRPVAVTAPSRLGADFASVPTWKELGVDAVYSSWRCTFGPKGMSSAQVAFWEETLAKIAETDDWKKDLEKNVRIGRHLDSKKLRQFLNGQNELLRGILTDIGMAKN